MQRRAPYLALTWSGHPEPAQVCHGFHAEEATLIYWTTGNLEWSPTEIERRLLISA
jgi:hypothetical protein